MLTIDWERVARVHAHPTRLLVLEAMLDGKVRSPSELAVGLDKDLGTIAYHVRCLARHGLLTLAHEQPVRGTTEHFYRLAAAAQQ